MWRGWHCYDSKVMSRLTSKQKKVYRSKSIIEIRDVKVAQVHCRDLCFVSSPFLRLSTLSRRCFSNKFCRRESLNKRCNNFALYSWQKFFRYEFWIACDSFKWGWSWTRNFTVLSQTLNKNKSIRSEIKLLREPMESHKTRLHPRTHRKSNPAEPCNSFPSTLIAHYRNKQRINHFFCWL